MSKERELLERLLTSELWSVQEELQAEIKKLLAQPEQTEQEPVAWKVIDKTNGEYMFSRIKPMERSYKYDVVIPLYTAPPKREPLSKEQYMKFFTDTYDSVNPITDFVRLVEKAHGIGGGE